MSPCRRQSFLAAVPCLLAGLLIAATCFAHGDGGHHADAPMPAAKVEVAAGEAPTLEVTLAPAADGALEARLETGRFRFAEEHAGQPHEPGEGHAHLLVDGSKVASVFGPVQRLPALDPGTHEVCIGLMTNDHRAYAVDGRAVAARFVVKVAAEGAATWHDFDVAIVGDKASPATVRVTQGEGVRLHLHSDAAAELHLHGYDIEAAIAPDDPVTLQFVAAVGGRFPLERHVEDGGGHGHGALLYLEVYPD